MIIYKKQESGQATDFQHAKKCPDGWQQIDGDKFPDDLTPYHEQKYIDSLKAVEYQKKRVYPSTGDQLDYIFHNGVEAWKTDIIQPVKDKFPKPF